MSSKRRGRVVYVGTGGGVPAALVPILSAYQASKWACEAFQQAFKQEMAMRNYPIDCCMINPGNIKPTGLQGVSMCVCERPASRLTSAVQQLAWRIWSERGK
jgi:NAD(P)-dependent dehydrogenase (short-subunit alcohol dehydrogenase family)